jgi:hypothetical protein
LIDLSHEYGRDYEIFGIAASNDHLYVVDENDRVRSFHPESFAILATYQSNWDGRLLEPALAPGGPLFVTAVLIDDDGEHAMIVALGMPSRSRGSTPSATSSTTMRKGALT